MSLGKLNGKEIMRFDGFSFQRSESTGRELGTLISREDGLVDVMGILESKLGATGAKAAAYPLDPEGTALEWLRRHRTMLFIDR